MESSEIACVKATNEQKPNRLINESSTYLLQHAHNPVDWYAWGPDALERAKRENKPILLSIGYAACHWCHVMEHESFEDPSTAELMNQNFINIKVDREERADLDEIYMKAVQMMTGHGGWPMTVFLTPQLKPFFGGTYFPPEDRHGLPGFKRLLHGISTAWKEQRNELEKSSEEITNHLRILDQVTPSTGTPLKHEIIDDAIDHLLSLFDHHWGGFGSAPKFPHTFSLSLAMRYAMPSSHARGSKRQECHELVTTTLNQMAYGGIHDQIGGGFARYSVDRQWLVPHFEKMLYDNALLCQSYFDGYLLTGQTYWKMVAEGILEFVSRELQTEAGAFYSSLDADSEGKEGKFYVWTLENLADALKRQSVSDNDIAWLSTIFGVTASGNFEHGQNVLHLKKSPEDLAAQYKMSETEFWSKLNSLKGKLLQARSERVRPGRDEKVLTSWNSLMISAFVDGYKVTGKDNYLQTAKRAAKFILTELMVDNRLLRTWGNGKAKLNAYLDDYAYFIHALLDLASVDFNTVWLEKASSLTETMLAHFWDESQGGFFYTSDDHEDLVTRPKNHFDGSVPSGTSVATFDLLRLALLTGNNSYVKKAEHIFDLYMPYMTKMPDQFSNLLCVANFHLSDKIEIAIVADTTNSAYIEYLSTIYSKYIPNKVVILQDINPGKEQGSSITLNQSPLLQMRDTKDNKPTVYICKNYTCDAPINNLTELKAKIHQCC